MKQLLQRLDTGETLLQDAPLPKAGDDSVVVETRATVVSAGTERMLVEFGRSGLIAKARSQPDKVRQVLDKVRTDGLLPTFDAVRAKLDAPIPLGYCNAGVVVDAGARSNYAVGDAVVSNGPHAEYVRVSRLLTARLPDGVSFEAAAFTPVAAIGLQGIRLAAPTLGESVVVYGLGLIGLLTVQLLRASGCRVLGVDRDPTRVALAQRFGALPLDGSSGDVVARVLALTEGAGADAVLLTLASDSDEPILRAAEMSRKRGRLVLVGVTGLQLSRDAFYKKELSFAVSCSYGPGRYDPAYEERGQDYPVGFVRWTEQRNFQAVLQLMADGALDPLPLVTHRFGFADAGDAYNLVAGPGASLGIVLTYPDRKGVVPERAARTIRVGPTPGTGRGVVGVFGAGNFAQRTLFPALKRSGATLHTVVSSGVSSTVAARKFGFAYASTDAESVFANSDIDAVMVLTRHDTHADLVVRALAAGKHVFVEKPLALTEAELETVANAARSASGTLTVGFNRRFAPLTTELRAALRGRAGPVTLLATMNAGAVPRDHWTQDPVAGGGRIVGEACHLIDLSRALVGAPIDSMSVVAARDRAGHPIDDIALLSFRFTDGSTAAINYLANGSRAFPKERVDCFVDGRTFTIDNWRRLRRFDGSWVPSFLGAARLDKGHDAELRAWLAAVRGEAAAPIPLDELLEVSAWSIRAAQAARGAP